MQEIIPNQSTTYTIQEVENVVTSNAVEYSDSETNQNIIYETNNIKVSIAPDRPIILTELKKTNNFFYNDSRVSFTASITLVRKDNLITEIEFINCLNKVHEKAKHIQMINLETDFDH